MNNILWVGSFMVLLSAYLLKHTIKSLGQFESSKSWPSVKGKIIESRAVRYQATSNRWDFIVKYEYLVKNKTYIGRRVALYTIIHQEEVDQLVNEYSAGKDVPVYYQSNKPSEAILITGGRENKKYGEVILACFVLIVGRSRYAEENQLRPKIKV